MRVLKPRQRPVFLTDALGHFQDNRTLSQRRLDREVDPTRATSAQHVNEQEIVEHLSDHREVRLDESGMQQGMEADQDVEAGAPVRKPMSDFGQASPFVVLLPKAEFLVDQPHHDLGLVGGPGVSGEELLDDRPLTVSPAISHFTGQPIAELADLGRR
jgi:hypothetical protein